MGSGALVAEAVPRPGVPLSRNLAGPLCLTLIHGVGVTQNGASRWINIGGQQLQPSEIAKLALAMWGADLLARKDRFGHLADWRHMLVPSCPGRACSACS